jgi:hypothetical protein
MLLQIDPEFKKLIEPLQHEEYEGLEKNIIANGCLDSIKVWLGNTIIDGHNRYEICQRHDIPFETKVMEFPSRNDAKIWIIRNQFDRRNLSAWQRGNMALKMKEIISEKAKENQLSGLKQFQDDAVPKNSWERMAEDEEIEKIWDDKGFSYDTQINLIDAVKAKYGRERKKIIHKEKENTYIAVTANKIKIGLSINSEARIDQLTTSDPDITLIETFSNGSELEKLLLKKFNCISLGGEWFTRTEENLKNILNYAKQENARLNETSVNIAKKAGVSMTRLQG